MDNSKIVELVHETIEAHIKKLTRNGGNMPPPDVELLCKDLCALEALKRLEDCGDGEHSYKRGRTSDGRFASHDSCHDSGESHRYYDGGTGTAGYSGHSKRDRLIDHLEQLMDAAQNESERQFLRNWLDRVNNS